MNQNIEANNNCIHAISLVRRNGYMRFFFLMHIDTKVFEIGLN